MRTREERREKREEKGFIIPAILSIMVALSIITGAVVLLIDSNFSLVGRNIQSQQAFNIAEAGVNYYLWHLSHNGTDFKDGKTTPTTPDATLGYGPYAHTYTDNNGKNIGTFTLWIKPQQPGSSSIATIRSIGKVTGSNTLRTIDAQIGAPSFASYAVVSDSALWFGNTETANGPVHSNQGVRMDGASNDSVTSPNTTYIPPSGLGGDGTTSHPGVWCDPSVTTPVNCNTRDKSDWRYPVPTIDFNIVDSSLCTMKKIAFASDPATSALATQSNACSQTPNTRTNAYLPRRGSNGAFSTKKGYLVELNPDGTYNLSNVDAENDTLATYTAALTRTSVATNLAIPASGVIFVEDNVWIRSNPTFHGRVTIAAGRIASASQNTEMTIADDLIYSSKNGDDVIGLVAENTITISPYAPPATGSFNFEVDAAVIGETGQVAYPSEYRDANNRCTRGWISPNQTYSYYGSVATRQSWTWSWLWNSSCGDNVYDASQSYYISGFKYNTTQYDYNLYYNPPPSWPSTSSYNILSWREVLVIP